MFTLKVGLDSNKYRDFSASEYDKEAMGTILINGKELKTIPDDFTNGVISENKKLVLQELYEKTFEIFDTLSFSVEKYDLEAEAKILDWIQKVQDGLIPLDNLAMDYDRIGKPSVVIPEPEQETKISDEKETAKQTTGNAAKPSANGSRTDTKSQTTSDLLRSIEE